MKNIALVEDANGTLCLKITVLVVGVYMDQTTEKIFGSMQKVRCKYEISS